MILNSSKKVESTCDLMSLFLQMQAVNILQKFTKIAELPLKGKEQRPCQTADIR